MKSLLGDERRIVRADRNLIDCVRANAFREVMDESWGKEGEVGVVDISWVARRISRSEDWVTGNWRRGYAFCHGHQEQDRGVLQGSSAAGGGTSVSSEYRPRIALCPHKLLNFICGYIIMFAFSMRCESD